MLDLERIVKLRTELAEVCKELDLISIRPSEVHLTQKGLLEVESDKSLWIVEERGSGGIYFSHVASVIMHGVKWFTLGSKEEFGVDEDTSD